MKKSKIKNIVIDKISEKTFGGSQNEFLINSVVDETLKAINYSQCCKSDSDQFFIFYKELQKSGRLYNDSLSEDIMKRDVDSFVKNK